MSKTTSDMINIILSLKGISPTTFNSFHLLSNQVTHQ